MDLGANEWTTFRKVTLPLIAPGILAGGAARVRALGRRLRDHATSTRAPTITFPLFVWGAARVGVAAAGERDRHGDLPRRGQA